MATVAELEAEIATLRAARAHGVLSTSYQGRSTTFHSLEAMTETIDRLEADLARAQAQATGAPRPTAYTIVPGTGL